MRRNNDDILRRRFPQVAFCDYVAAMPQDTPSRHLDQFLVRFPDGMRVRLKEEAAKNGRSMNAEIVTRLESTFDADKINDAAYGPRMDASKKALMDAAMELIRRVEEDLANEGRNETD